MNRVLGVVSLGLLPICVLGYSAAFLPLKHPGVAKPILGINKPTTKNLKHAAAETYYTLQDFSRVQKFDSHIHLNTLEPAFIHLAEKENFRFLDIVDDRPFGLPMVEQEKIAVQDQKTFPKQMAFATTFPVIGFDEADWAERTIAHLKQSITNGAKAVKIWKNIGMSLKDKNGHFVMVDDSRLDPVLNYLEKNNIPLVGHNGEPRDCWLPLDKMTFSQDYYGGHPEYHMYLHPEYPSYMDQINARDHMLKKHPKLQFIGAHLGSLEWSLDELGKRLDLYPNMRVDLSRMSNLQLHALQDWQKTRKFFLKYQDRLVYGTDQAINAAKDPAKLKKQVRENWEKDWKFFVTNDEISLERFGMLKGLKLPKSVIDKIYYSNANKWLAGKPVRD
jgi:predicted TIM-barrel fold metal-dependent hydrolase